MNNAGSSHSIFDMRLFGRRSEVELSGSVLIARSIDFFGAYCTSPNSEYAIAWDQDSGVFVLARGGQILVTGHVRNPFLGKVSDSGIFALSSHGTGSSPSATLRVFNEQGDPILTKHFSFFLNAIGIANDGRYVACQLVDGEAVLIDLSSGETVWKQDANPATNLRLLASDIQIDTAKGWVILNLESVGDVRIGLNGEYLDSDLIEPALLQNARAAPNGLALFYLVRDKIDRLGKDISPDDGENLLALLGESFQLGFTDYPDVEAKAYRAMGEVHEAINELEAALRLYRAALQRDPKVGVKRKVETLQRKLTARKE